MIEKISALSKEAIKLRMLQNAVKIWGLKNISSVDPFVALLIDAFSTEIFRSNNEIQAANSRIVEKLAKLLTPSTYTLPQPAHAIGQSLPNEATEILPSHTEYFIKKKFPSTVKSVADVSIDIHFTPVDDVRLVNITTEFLITANTTYRYDDEQNKIPLIRTPANSVKHNKIFLGLNATQYNESTFPKTLSLYCSNPTFEYVDYVFKLLPFIRVFNNGNELSLQQGLKYEDHSTEEGYEGIFAEHSAKKRIENNIKNIYKDKFLTISGLTLESINDTIPEAINFIRNEKFFAYALQGKKMLWLELDFPPQYNSEVLENFSFALNAFPVYNRKWKSSEYELKVMGNNVPLATEVSEHFLYVDKVEDSNGNVYDDIPFQSDKDVQNKGLYTVRKGGMERFNERNAIEMIENVLELTRDEVSAFGILNRDQVSGAITRMTRLMKLLDQRITNAERSVIQEINYVIANPYDNIKNMRAAYWVTHCSLANNIRVGTNLDQPKVDKVVAARKLKLLTATIGGNQEQKGTNAIQAYKYALTTRDKLISIEDIKNFCYLMLQNELKSVDVRRGTMISNKPKEGFIRTIEIEVTPNTYSYLGKQYWDNMAVTLKHQIALKGIDGVEYTVKIKNEDDE